MWLGGSERARAQSMMRERGSGGITTKKLRLVAGCGVGKPLPSDEYVKGITEAIILRAGHGIEWPYSQGILVHYEEIRPVPSKSAELECTLFYFGVIEIWLTLILTLTLTLTPPFALVYCYYFKVVRYYSLILYDLPEGLLLLCVEIT